MVRYPVDTTALPKAGDGAEGAPSPMRDEPAPSSDDPHGPCSRVLLDMAQERDKARAASAASERAYREARAGADDNLSRLLDCREVVQSLTAERDASRTAHAALVAELRALCDEWDEASFVYIRHVRAALDCHTAGA